MKGIHRVIVQNKKLHYEFEIKRNITIIQGDSATGKTTLIDMIRSYENLGADSGITVSCDVPCRVLEGANWELLISNSDGVIFFADEENAFIHTKEFARAISESNNYYVLITRENLYELPYSVEEIYGIHSSGRYQNTKQIYNETYHIYSLVEEFPIRPKCIITEDSESGFDFFKAIADENGISCRSSYGNAGIIKTMDKTKDTETCVIADGAAFGAYMNPVYYNVRKNKHIHLYLPESFEWILLKSGLIDGNELKEILDKPWENIDSKDYMSWERYFTSLIISMTKDTYLSYNKSIINENYLHPQNVNRILAVMEGIELGSCIETEQNK